MEMNLEPITARESTAVEKERAGIVLKRDTKKSNRSR